MKHCVFLVASLFLAGCVIPVPVERAVLEGKPFADSELDFLGTGSTTRREVIDHLGDPTLWLSAQRILVYGLRRVETGVLWFIGAGPGAALGGLEKGESREAVFMVLDDEDVVTHWGRAAVRRGETWLSAATEWAGSKALPVPQARGRFVEETPGRQQGLVYFYRPRDYQYFLPLVPPAGKMPPGIADYADIRQDGKLLGQIRWQSYVAVRVPPGTCSFEVNADTDYVVNPGNYRSKTIRLDIAPQSVTFVDVGIRAGLGTIEPVLVSRPRSEAIEAIQGLRESW